MFDDKIKNTLQLRMILNNKISVLEKKIHIFAWLIIFFNFFWQFQKVINLRLNQPMYYGTWKNTTAICYGHNSKMESCLKRPFTPNVISWVTLCYETLFYWTVTYDIMFNTKSAVAFMPTCNVSRMLIQSYVNIEYPAEHRFLEEKCNVMEFIKLLVRSHFLLLFLFLLQKNFKK
jgi:hypothetical protein